MNPDRAPPLLLLDRAAHPVIGHRGAAAYAPENTLESFRQAVLLGAEALEFDLRSSRDGVAMVMHDPTLDRTTNQRGPIGAFTADELARADAGFRFVDEDGDSPYRGRGIGVPRLREVLEAFPDLPLLLEIKEAAVQEAVARDLLETGAVTRTVVAGEDWRALAAFAEPPFLRGASRRDIAATFFGWGRPDPACRNYAVPDRHRGLTIPSRRFVRKAHALGSTVHVWTVDDARGAMRHWKAGANGIVSNRPDVILAARTAWESAGR